MSLHLEKKLFTSPPGLTKLCFGLADQTSVSDPNKIDQKATKELVKCLRENVQFESETMLTKRQLILDALNGAQKDWVRDLTMKKFTNPNAEQMNGKIFMFGSCQLGVQTQDSDMDLLLVVPRHIERKDFFEFFPDFLNKISQVEYVHLVVETSVPIIKTKIDGIELDLAFGRLELEFIPEDLHLRDNNLLIGLDEKSVSSLNGCRVTDDIFHLIPNYESFSLALKAVKLWAVRRGIYSNAFGYLGGVSWAILVARTCQLHPNETAPTLLQMFFRKFSKWFWPEPVLLRPNSEDNGNLGLDVWNPYKNAADRLHLMPIITPSYPQQNTTFNVTKSSKKIIKKEMELGLSIIDEIMLGTKTWQALFEPVPFFCKYQQFVVVIVSGGDDEWTKLVQSKIRILGADIEQNQSIKLAHVHTQMLTRMARIRGSNSNETDRQLNKRQECMWFIGLKLVDVNENTNIDLKPASVKFLDKVKPDKAQIDIRVVFKSDLPFYVPTEELSRNIQNIHCVAGAEKKFISNQDNQPQHSNKIDQEDEWKELICKKLVLVLKNDSGGLIRVMCHLNEQERKSVNIGQDWRTLKSLLNSDDAFQLYVKGLAKDPKHTKRDPTFFKAAHLFNEYITTPSDQPLPEDVHKDWDSIRKNHLEKKENSSLSYFERAWRRISNNMQNEILNMVTRENVIASIDKFVSLFNQFGQVYIIAGLATVYFSAIVIYDLHRWWNGEITGKRCAKNMVDSTIAMSGGIAGGISGSVIGGLVGPVGAIIGGVIGSFLSFQSANIISSRLTYTIFNLPKDEVLEKAYNYFGVNMTSSNSAINTAFRKKCLEHHPDKGGDKNAFLLVQTNMQIIKMARETNSIRHSSAQELPWNYTPKICI